MRSNSQNKYGHGQVKAFKVSLPFPSSFWSHVQEDHSFANLGGTWSPLPFLFQHCFFFSVVFCFFNLGRRLLVSPGRLQDAVFVSIMLCLWKTSAACRDTVVVGPGFKDISHTQPSLFVQPNLLQVSSPIFSPASKSLLFVVVCRCLSLFVLVRCCSCCCSLFVDCSLIFC